MKISFCIRKNSDLHLRKMQFNFCVGKNLGLHLRLHLFWLQRIFGNAFTPACVFGRYWKFGQTELVFRVDYKIRHFRHKTNSSFVLPSNELHLSHSLEASHTHSSQTQGWYSPSSVRSSSILSLTLVWTPPTVRRAKTDPPTVSFLHCLSSFQSDNLTSPQLRSTLYLSPTTSPQLRSTHLQPTLYKSQSTHL